MEQRSGEDLGRAGQGSCLRGPQLGGDLRSGCEGWTKSRETLDWGTRGGRGPPQRGRRGPAGRERAAGAGGKAAGRPATRVSKVSARGRLGA